MRETKLATNIMLLKTLRIFLFFNFFAFYGLAQNCTLNIGAENAETLANVFQMNKEQIAKMNQLSAELKIEVEVVEGEIQKLFAQQPQSTPEELSLLASKYKVLQQKIVQASIATDKKLLETFNVKQYQRYLELCNEALRDPIKVVPLPLKANEVNPE